MMGELFMKRKRILGIFLFVLAGAILSGCKTEKKEIKKLKDLEFTVVEDADLPEELKELIAEKKAEPFKLSYSNEAFLFIVTGYGEQKTGGYSIQVDSLYETGNAIYLDTTLQGPGKDEKVENALSYPYIVIKTELIDKSVVFE